MSVESIETTSTNSTTTELPIFLQFKFPGVLYYDQFGWAGKICIMVTSCACTHISDMTSDNKSKTSVPFSFLQMKRKAQTVHC